MVFGLDLLENVTCLAQLVDSIEIVLFHTPTCNNTPSEHDLHSLDTLGKKNNITFTVHLPASLEIASNNRSTREASIQLAIALCEKTSVINPVYYILHVPFSKPTLVPVPGLYFKDGDQQQWKDWTQRSLDALHRIIYATGLAGKLLIENINYSPCFLEPFWEKGLGEPCLDLGHMLLGNEDTLELLQTYLHTSKEIHIHGVVGYEEHLSLSVLPENLVKNWLKCIDKSCFNGIVNLEVFSPGDLQESMAVVFEYFASQST